MINLITYAKDVHKYFPTLTSDPWEITASMELIVIQKLKTLGDDFIIRDNIAIHKSANIEEHVVIKPPAIICAKCFIAAHAYLRGGVFIGESSTIGPGTEIKSSIILESTALAHFNFAGDSLIASNVNLEAGAVIANHFNERADKTIYVMINGRRKGISNQKFGALIGDGTRIGANAVLSPGTILEVKSVVGRLELVDQCR